MRFTFLLSLLLSCALLHAQTPVKKEANGDSIMPHDITSSSNSYIEDGISPSFKMIAIPAGTFMMGCTNEQDSECEIDEKPAHQVTLSSFYIGETEVTQAQWRAVMGTNPSHFSGCADCPVENVSWDDIQNFLSQLNTKCSKHYRLPTEAEWEYAAKGGQPYKYAGSNNIDEVAWHYDNANSKTHRVKGLLANGYGLYDMTGNVWEWCNDWYEINYYDKSSLNNPQGASARVSRVLHGGSWFNFTRDCRVSDRLTQLPSFLTSGIGFRLAVSQ